jgi:hypothetical protein
MSSGRIFAKHGHVPLRVRVPARRMGRTLFLIVGVCWVAAVSVGLSVLWAYENGPGGAADAPEQWPVASHLPAPHQRPALVLLVHPQCPCSHATVAELARLMAHAPDRVDAHVLFLKPRGMSESWAKSDLWQNAAAIPGVDVRLDEGGVEAQRFGGATSGETLLYDTAGHLQFNGGITGSRGHEGDNAGRSTLESLLTGGTSGTKLSTLVFGCALFAPRDEAPVQ